MKTTTQYLDAVKVIRGISSDRELSRNLGWNRSTISAYREGRSHLNNEHALQLAEILGRNPLELIGAAEAERAKTEEKKVYWASLVKKFAGVTAALILMMTLTLPQTSSIYLASSGDTLYIMSTNISTWNLTTKSQYEYLPFLY